MSKRYEADYFTKYLN